jgi:hypothetical protein
VEEGVGHEWPTTHSGVTSRRAAAIVRAVRGGRTGEDLTQFIALCLAAHERDTIQSLWKEMADGQ